MGACGRPRTRSRAHAASSGGAVVSGKRDNLKVTAIVSVRMSIELTQPWDAKATMEDVFRQAEYAAKEKLHIIFSNENLRGIDALFVYGIEGVKTVTTERDR